jgi:hypothetical protein
VTKDEILALVPGREMDALVAEKVMGWTGRKTVYQWFDRKRHEYPLIIFAIGGEGMGSYETFVDGEGNKIQYGNPHKVFFTPNYSTDIAAAWEIIRKLNKKDIYLEVKQWFGQELWIRLWTGSGALKSSLNLKSIDAFPEGICKAALLAKGG